MKPLKVAVILTVASSRERAHIAPCKHKFVMRCQRNAVSRLPRFMAIPRPRRTRSSGRSGRVFRPCATSQCDTACRRGSVGFSRSQCHLHFKRQNTTADKGFGNLPSVQQPLSALCSDEGCSQTPTRTEAGTCRTSAHHSDTHERDERIRVRSPRESPGAPRGQDS